jgi:transketolase
MERWRIGPLSKKILAMPLLNAFSKMVTRDFSMEELEQAALLMRGYALVALRAANSEHSASALSMMEIAAALYLKVATHDPNHPEWSHRDRIVWAADPRAPALYLGLAFGGYLSIEEAVTSHELYSPSQGNLKLPGVEVASGFSHQGRSLAVDMALAGRLDHDEHTVFCIMGGGGQQDDRLWEAVMEASRLQLDNLVGIIERNRFEIDGTDSDKAGLNLERYRGFGWEVIEVDGREMKQVVIALQKAKNVPALGKPTLIVANSSKGQDSSLMNWRDDALNYEEMVRALDELGLRNVIAYDAFLKLAEERKAGEFPYECATTDRQRA